MKAMSSMMRPYPFGRSVAVLPRLAGPSPNVDGNRVRVREGEEADLIRIA